MKNNKDNTEVASKETARLETFSDGVFAIAITLLILELIQNLHLQGDEPLIKHLLGHWQSLFAFAIGFLTILICWINHHLVFNYITKVNSSLMWVNGFVLFVVTFTPFPTAVLAEYFKTERHNAMAFFGFNYFMVSLAAYSLTSYAYKTHLIQENNRELFYCFIRLYRYSIVYTFLVFFVCFISIPISILLYCILFIVFAYPKEFGEKLRTRKKLRTKKIVTPE
jgi:uncharacterized membrane protein